MNKMIKMSVTLSFFFSLFVLIHIANAFNITKILDQYPDFSTFNSYLTQTNLAGEINGRQTITVLAVENSNLSPFSGKPLQVLKDMLSVHVVLDYYDVPKLTKLSNNSAILTTLFQSTGQAQNHQGFLNVTKLSTGGVAFGSAVPGSTLGSNLVKLVASQPFNISVLQVSNIIVPEGIDDVKTSPPPPKASPPALAPRPSQAPPPRPSHAPAPARKVGPPPKAKAPTPISEEPTANEPTADEPTANEPTADEPPADKDTSKSVGTALHMGPAGVLTMVFSTLYLASRI